MSSSRDLHPESGARFVFTREPESDPIRYRVEVYLPARRLLVAQLGWTDEGVAELEPPLADPWVQQEALKLALVVRREPKAVLKRWRGQ